MRAVTASLLLLLFCDAPLVQAAILERDWKAPGDGLLTYDTVNHREWLELTESILAPFGGTTGQEFLDNAVAQLEPGGLLEDFIWASSGDAREFVLSAGIDLTTEDYDTNAEPVMNLLELIGITVSSIPHVTVGHVNDEQLIVIEYLPVQTPFARALIGQGVAGDLSRPATSGLMLYRDVVPEPSAVLLAATAVLLLLPRMWRGELRP